jgi:hypothetical protein
MAAPATRQQLVDYCLRKLGHPVTEINVDDDQVEDRIDDAFQYYRDYHYDAVQRLFMKHMITASRMTVTSNVVSSTVNLFALGETITGSISGATGLITQEGPGNTSTGTTLLLQNIRGTFVAGDVLAGNRSTGTATMVSIALGDMDNGYIPLSDAIINVVRVLPFTDTKTGMDYMFDLRYQLRLNDLFDLLSTSIIYYQQIKSHLSLIEMLLVGQKTVEFSRHTNRMYLDMDWKAEVNPGEYIIVECYRILDPTEFPDVYNDWFLKRYATALIKRQWGENLKKFEGIQMPGGVTLNGQKIWEEAIAEIDNLENEMESRYQAPPNFFLG